MGKEGDSHAGGHYFSQQTVITGLAGAGLWQQDKTNMGCMGVQEIPAA